jgi:uncharacterized protein (TIGR02217 family)
MAFFEALFPPRISANAQGGPRFITEKAYTASGRRSTNRLAALPLADYAIDHPVREAADFEELRAFFYVVGGDADGFRFKDWSDFVLTDANSRLDLVSGTTWQIERLYTFGARTLARPIQKPVAGAVVHRLRGMTHSTVTTTVDSTTGQCVIGDHVDGDTYTAVGQFHVPVAFKDPKAVWKFIGGSRGLTEWTGIDLEEFRL